jgi:hypothetical protein
MLKLDTCGRRGAGHTRLGSIRMRSGLRCIAVSALAIAALNACGNSTSITPTAPTPAPLPRVGSVDPADSARNGALASRQFKPAGCSGSGETRSAGRISP